MQAFSVQTLQDIVVVFQIFDGFMSKQFSCSLSMRRNPRRSPTQNSDGAHAPFETKMQYQKRVFNFHAFNK